MRATRVADPQATAQVAERRRRFNPGKRQFAGGARQAAGS